MLVTGETGTGKELVAQALHFNSPRRERPFVAVNCAAIPETLLESELFGHKRGAFTDARIGRAGLFVEADGGTLFLDEIGELSPALQAKLLRVLQEGEIRPLGAARSQKIDVRVVAATNQDLEERLANGSFREDLFYRLNVIHIHLPPLRDAPRTSCRWPSTSWPAAPAKAGEGHPRVSRGGEEAAARLRLAGQRARAGERRRARRGAGRGDADQRRRSAGAARRARPGAGVVGGRRRRTRWPPRRRAG